ncbi:MAG: hypothetical protein F6K40_26580 [Okeania sp. SIO3I5]|uniref:hypothetical protein n=1 Tax=Okeania sp. SIO3I5 TaxID=2607805 RepID=UPI0013BB3B89|nr:hypothetical protein [Okeania sp. SIO3I5]NEQ39627.1 hypothetical protein [Okeania sp. SIO3I5]
MSRLLLYTQSKRKSDYPSPRRGASQNVSTIALYATEEKFEDSSLLLSKFQKKI